MRKSNFKQKYLVFLVALCFISIGLYYSYAIFVTKQLQENVVLLKTKQNFLDYDINGSKEVKVLPNDMKTVTLNIQNNGTKSSFYEVFMQNENGVKVTTSDKTKGEIEKNAKLSMTINIANTLNSSSKVLFKVLSSTHDDIIKEIGYNYINEEENFDHSHANKPNLDGLKLIPVVYQVINDTEGDWVIADKTNKNSLWYSYEHGMWANAVLVSDKVYKKYQNKSVGDIVNLDETEGLYVWIPRFKYVIMNNSSYTNYEKLNNIIFEEGVNKTGTVSCIDALSSEENMHIYSEVCNDVMYGKIYDNLSTYTHPAFTSEGFWVSKFLIGNNTKSLPNVIFVKKNINDAVMDSESLIKGKTHLLTNMEYASIVMLSNSMYGKSGNSNYLNKDNYTFKRIYVNTNVNDVTGCSTEYNKYSKNFITMLNSNCIAYNDLTSLSHVANSINYPIGQLGPGSSSTGTIYGVYDLANRYGELVAAYSVSLKDDVNASHYDLYSDNAYTGLISSSKSISNLYRYKLGDAIKENIRSLSENGMWSSGMLEQKTNGVIIRGGNGDIKNASVYTSSMVDIDTISPYRVVISK